MYIIQIFLYKNANSQNAIVFLTGEPAIPLCSHENQGYGFQDYGKPWFFHGSQLCLQPLQDFAGLIIAALVDLYRCWVNCFYSFNTMGKTLAL